MCVLAPRLTGFVRAIVFNGGPSVKEVLGLLDDVRQRIINNEGSLPCRPLSNAKPEKLIVPDWVVSVDGLYWLLCVLYTTLMTEIGLYQKMVFDRLEALHQYLGKQQQLTLRDNSDAVCTICLTATADQTVALPRWAAA